MCFSTQESDVADQSDLHFMLVTPEYASRSLYIPWMFIYMVTVVIVIHITVS